MERACTKCGVTKPVTPEFFHPGKGYRDGFSRQCKKCRNAAMRARNVATGYEKMRYKRDKAKRDAHVRKWIEADIERARASRDKSPSRHPDRRYANAILRNYGVTWDQYQSMWKAQGGVCAICGGLPTGRISRLVVDHCHETGVVRGLLCGECNRGLGYFKHEVERFEQAAQYLKAAAAQPTNVIQFSERNPR